MNAIAHIVSVKLTKIKKNRAAWRRDRCDARTKTESLGLRRGAAVDGAGWEAALPGADKEQVRGLATALKADCFNLFRLPRGAADS